MIVLFYGTSAEYIKMYGIISSIPRDQLLLICNAQQYAGLQHVHAQMGIEPDLYIGRGWKRRDVANMRQMTGMMFLSHVSFVRQYRAIKKRLRDSNRVHGTRSIVFVHGDTLTTVVGAYLGRSLGLRVAHVESGLRSGSWKSPFPEELDRRIASKLCAIHFPPNDTAENNLRVAGTKGTIINTGFTTAKDAIERSDEFVSKDFKKLKLPTHYCLVLLHRTELLENRNDLELILKTIRDHAHAGNKIVFTEHTTTQQKIKQYKLASLLEHKNIKIIHKQPYFDFMAIVKHADYVVTDGGGLQEDCYFLGIPVVIHRMRTERHEGLGENAILSKMNVEIVADFLQNHPNKSNFLKIVHKTSPSKVVTDFLAKEHYVTFKN